VIPTSEGLQTAHLPVAQAHLRLVDQPDLPVAQRAGEVTQEREPEDLVIEKEGAVVLVDSVSLDFLRGTRIDFVDDLIGQSFKIDNPNVKASCGCGASFTV